MTTAAFTAAMALMLKYQRMRLTMDEVADELGIARNTLANQRARGDDIVPTYLEGNRRYADVRDVGEYLDRQRAAARVAFDAAQQKRAA